MQDSSDSDDDEDLMEIDELDDDQFLQSERETIPLNIPLEVGTFVAARIIVESRGNHGLKYKVFIGKITAMLEEDDFSVFPQSEQIRYIHISRGCRCVNC